MTVPREPVRTMTVNTVTRRGAMVACTRMVALSMADTVELPQYLGPTGCVLAVLHAVPSDRKANKNCLMSDIALPLVPIFLL